MKPFEAGAVWLLVVMIAMPWHLRVGAQTTGGASAASAPSPASAQPAAVVFKPEEIEQLVAPIALYPDSLVSQILMASTYPLEVVEADRWAKANKNLKGDSFAAELEKQRWDPSVKSLVNFPQVLSMMSEKLEMTQKLGDVFLAQQKDVLDAVQRLRAKAQASGNLKTTQEQKVIIEQAPPATQTTTIIKIEPANPRVVYVPTYNPTVVYGAWPYPAYPPYYYYPPGYVATTAAFSFAAGVAVGAAWGYAWGGCNWGRGDVDIDIHRNVNINNTHINRTNYQRATRVDASGRGSWQHDASHRKGVAYRDNATAQKFNRGTNAQAAQARENFRGRAESGRQDLGRNAGDRGGLASREGGVADRGGLKSSGSGGPGGRRDAQSGGALANRSEAARGTGAHREADAFQGVGKGRETRSASARGAQSRAGAGSKDGGGFHGGGGRRG
jgi:hypothetical protein